MGRKGQRQKGEGPPFMSFLSFLSHSPHLLSQGAVVLVVASFRMMSLPLTMSREVWVILFLPRWAVRRWNPVHAVCTSKGVCRVPKCFMVGDI